MASFLSKRASRRKRGRTAIACTICPSGEASSRCAIRAIDNALANLSDIPIHTTLRAENKLPDLRCKMPLPIAPNSHHGSERCRHEMKASLGILPVICAFQTQIDTSTYFFEGTRQWPVWAKMVSESATRSCASSCECRISDRNKSQSNQKTRFPCDLTWYKDCLCECEKR